MGKAAPPMPPAPVASQRVAFAVQCNGCGAASDKDTCGHCGNDLRPLREAASAQAALARLNRQHPRPPQTSGYEEYAPFIIPAAIVAGSLFGGDD